MGLPITETEAAELLATGAYEAHTSNGGQTVTLRLAERTFGCDFCDVEIREDTDDWGMDDDGLVACPGCVAKGEVA